MYFPGNAIALIAGDSEAGADVGDERVEVAAGGARKGELGPANEPLKQQQQPRQCQCRPQWKHWIYYKTSSDGANPISVDDEFVICRGNTVAQRRRPDQWPPVGR